MLPLDLIDPLSFSSPLQCLSSSWSSACSCRFTRSGFNTEFTRSCVRQNAAFRAVPPHSGECSYGFETTPRQRVLGLCIRTGLIRADSCGYTSFLLYTFAWLIAGISISFDVPRPASTRFFLTGIDGQECPSYGKRRTGMSIVPGRPRRLTLAPARVRRRRPTPVGFRGTAPSDGTFRSDRRSAFPTVAF